MSLFLNEMLWTIDKSKTKQIDQNVSYHVVAHNTFLFLNITSLLEGESVWLW